MGRTVDAILTNKLTKQEILTLPKLLIKKQPLNTSGEQWNWQVNEIDEKFLDKYWKRDANWYSNELRSKKYDKIYNEAIIIGPDKNIRFFEANLIIISFDFKWFEFKINEEIRNKVTKDIITFSKILEAEKIVITYNIGSGETRQEKDGTNFGNLKNLIDSFIVTKRDFEILEQGSSDFIKPKIH